MMQEPELIPCGSMYPLVSVMVGKEGDGTASVELPPMIQHPQVSSALWHTLVTSDLMSHSTCGIGREPPFEAAK